MQGAFKQIRGSCHQLRWIVMVFAVWATFVAAIAALTLLRCMSGRHFSAD